MNDTKHTPQDVDLSVEVKHAFGLYKRDSGQASVVDSIENDVLRAVNSHDELVNAVAELLAICDDTSLAFSADMISAVVNDARAAIAKARE